MTLPKPLTDVLQEVFSREGEEKRKRVEQDPAACLLSLLTCIKKRLPRVSATLVFTVEEATFETNIEAARRKLEEVPSP